MRHCTRSSNRSTHGTTPWHLPAQPAHPQRKNGESWVAQQRRQTSAPPTQCGLGGLRLESRSLKRFRDRSICGRPMRGCRPKAAARDGRGSTGTLADLPAIADLQAACFSESGDQNSWAAFSPSPALSAWWQWTWERRRGSWLHAPSRAKPKSCRSAYAKSRAARPRLGIDPHGGHKSGGDGRLANLSRSRGRKRCRQSALRRSGLREVGSRPAYYQGTRGVRGDGLILKRVLRKAWAEGGKSIRLHPYSGKGRPTEPDRKLCAEKGLRMTISAA